MAKLSFLEVVCVFISVVLRQETTAISLSTEISTLPPSTTFNPKAAVCDGVTCPIGRKCAIGENHRPVCVCIDVCSSTVDMVCGTDGRSYANECQLRKETCLTDKSIRVAHKGFCLEGSVCYGHQCPPDKQCTVDQNSRPVCICNTSCTYEYNPVCGSDGVTYYNSCELKIQACTTITNLTMARTGPCIYVYYCNGVVCPSPKFCVVDVKNQTSCVCKDDCGDYYDPVCGSDNKTYDSQCHMETIACKTNTSITTNYNGVCSEGSNCEGIRCLYGKHCDSQHQPELKCVCDTDCPKFYKPFCGTNNKTYNNSCELTRDICLTDTFITAWFNRRCDEGPGCSFAYCPNGRTCALDERNQPTCLCPQYCNGDSNEVCGTDNKTYTNACFLNAAACFTNKSITVQSYDQCRATVCVGFSCTKGRRCAVNERHEPVCVCIEGCPYTMDIVCGGDGRTYTNECELQKKACTSGTNTQVAYKGYCLEGSVCYRYRCPSDRVCHVNQYNQPVCVCNESCPSDYNPVCGSDGSTYYNLCEMKRQACTKGTNLTVARTGKCIYNEYCNGVVCPFLKSCVVDAENQTSCVCDYKCGYYSPLCSSDNKTYNSYCEMNAALCEANTSITTYYYGVCSEGSNCQGINCGDGKHCDSVNQPEPKCVCNTVCPKFYSPLCGSNNKTYNNSCELQRDACLTNTPIAEQFNRRCEEGPGCLYTICPSGRTCVVDERNRPFCVCSLNCGAGSTEICGTDNKTYSGECFITAAACLTNKTITVQHYGQCKEEASTATTIAGHP